MNCNCQFIRNLDVIDNLGANEEIERSGKAFFIAKLFLLLQ